MLLGHGFGSGKAGQVWAAIGAAVLDAVGLPGGAEQWGVALTDADEVAVIGEQVLDGADHAIAPDRARWALPILSRSGPLRGHHSPTL